jgi:hypothetical protein
MPMWIWILLGFCLGIIFWNYASYGLIIVIRKIHRNHIETFPEELFILSQEWGDFKEIEDNYETCTDSINGETDVRYVREDLAVKPKPGNLQKVDEIWEIIGEYEEDDWKYLQNNEKEVKAKILKSLLDK